MARRTYDYYTKVAYCTTLTVSAPTTIQLNAGTDLSTFITKDGLRPGGSQNKVDQGDISTLFSAETIGTWKSDFELMCYRDFASDDAWDALDTIGEVGFIVVRRGVAHSTAWASSQDVEVYPVQVGTRIMGNSAADENQKFSVKFGVTAEPGYVAVA